MSVLCTKMHQAEFQLSFMILVLLLNLACSTSLVLLEDTTYIVYLCLVLLCMYMSLRHQTFMNDEPAATLQWNTTAMIKTDQNFIAVFFVVMPSDYARKYLLLLSERSNMSEGCSIVNE